VWGGVKFGAFLYHALEASRSGRSAQVFTGYKVGWRPEPRRENQEFKEDKKWRKIFECKMERERRILYNEELHALYSSTNTVRGGK
jgi:hypothetical protein